MEETEKDKINSDAWFKSSQEFTKHLNIIEIHPHIRPRLTDSESDSLILSDDETPRKIAKLMNCFPKKGGNWFGFFVKALQESSKPGTGHHHIVAALRRNLPIPHQNEFDILISPNTNNTGMHIMFIYVASYYYCI